MKLKFTLNSITKLQIIKAIFNILCRRSQTIYQQFMLLLQNYFAVAPEQLYPLASGRMAIYSLIKSLALTSNDEVIVTGYTCVVVTNAVKLSGCKLKYIDINANTLNIDSTQLLNNITPQTKLIIISHNFGIVYQDIDLIKKQYPNIIILEDAAHTLGSKYKDTLAGLLGDASFLSFEYSKPITCGIGGLLIINNPLLINDYRKIYNDITDTSKLNIFKIICTTLNYSLFYFKSLPSFNRYTTAILRRLHLLYRTNQHELNGGMPNNYPSLLSPVLSVFLYYQMYNIQQINHLKQNQAQRYNEYFAKIQGIKTYYDSNNIYVRYPILFEDNIPLDTIHEIKYKLLNHGYNFGVWFDDVVHPHGSYRYMYKEGSCPIGEKISQRIINLPININYPLSIDDIKAIQSIIVNALGNIHVS